MFSPSINVAKRLLAHTDDKAHDLNHAHRVAMNAAIIGRSVNYDNIDLLEVCGWWHDVGRTIRDDGHEQISAELLVNELSSQGVSREICRVAYQAIVFHKWNMTPKTQEGYIIRDADKLDFISVERWQACIDSGQPEHLRDIKQLLGKLPELLVLEVSRDLYIERLPTFMNSGLIDLV